jgi:formyltetrahydrofolate deformylase
VKADLRTLNQTESEALRWRVTIECCDRLGLVAIIAQACQAARANIIDSAQYTDPEHHRFFMRIEVAASATEALDLDNLLCRIADEFGLTFRIQPTDHRPRTLVMVSKEGHCLADILYRHESGDLAIDVAVVVSNHERWRSAVERHGLPFVYLPVGADGHEASVEPALRTLIARNNIELIVLARYMQVVSASFCSDFEGRVVNIHHSFLPSFKGARPYRQAYDNGVKLVGATAHFVSAELDGGPIIEQAVMRVDHRCNAAEMVRRGRDIETTVLATALTWIAQARVFRNGQRTVIL